MARIDEVTIVWKADTKDLDRAKASLLEVDKAVRQTEASSEKAEKAIVDVGKATTKAGKESTTATQGAAAAQSNLTTTITKTTAATTVMGGTAGKVFAGIKTQLASIGPLLAGAFAIHQIASFTSNIINLGTEFTSVMSRVQALTQATDAEFAILEERAKELGATTQFSASQAAEAMVFLAQAGFNTKQIFDALPGTLQLAAAGQLDLAQAADIASNVLSGYGLAAEELNRVNDLIVGTTSKANTNVTQFAEAFKVAGPIAKSAGITIEEVSSIIGVLGNAGIQGSLGGTALRGTISSLIKPSTEAAKELKKLGITTKDASGNLLPLNEIFQQLKDANVDTSQLFTIFGERAASAASVLSEAGTTVGDFAEVLGGSVGIAAKIASEQMDNLRGDGLELESAFEGRVLQVFEAFEPILRGVTQAITILINNLGAFMKLVLVGVVGITAYTAATRGLTIAFGLYSNVLKAVRAAMLAFNAAMASNPAGLIAAGLAAAATALIVFRKELAAAVSGQKALTDTQQEFLDMTAKEEGQLRTLFDALNKATIGSKTRKAAIDEINKSYGSYLPNMLTEESTALDIENAYRLINEQLIQKIALQQKEKELTEANTKFVTDVRDAFSGLSTVQIEAVKEFAEMQAAIDAVDVTSLAFDGKLATNELERLKEAANNVGVNSGAFGIAVNKYRAALKYLNISLADTEAFFATFIDNTKEAIGAIGGEDGEDLAAPLDALELLKKRIEELGKQLLLQSLAGKINNGTLTEYKNLTNQLAEAQYRLKTALEGTSDWMSKQSDILINESVKGASSALDYYTYLEETAKASYAQRLIDAEGNAAAIERIEMAQFHALQNILIERLEFERSLLQEGTLEYIKKNNEILQAELALQKNLSKATEEGEKERARIREQMRLDAQEREKNKEKEDEERRKYVQQATISLAQELNGALQEITARRFAFEDNMITQQLEKGLISEEQAFERRKELRRQEAQQAKTFAVFDILLKTAQAIMAALAQGGPIGAVQAAFAAATGAVQLGVAASTPLPFAEGVIDLAGNNKGKDSVHALLAPGESVMTHKETQKYKPVLQSIRDGVFDKEYLPLRTVKPEFAASAEDGGSQMDTAEMEYLLGRVWRANEAGAEKIANAVTKSMKKQGKRYYI